MVTAEVGTRGATRILGGNANLRRIGALPAWDQFPVAADGEIRRLAPGYQGLGAVAVVVARALGHPGPSLAVGPAADRLPRRAGHRARGPGDRAAAPHGPRGASDLRGRIVVVGATAAVDRRPARRRGRRRHVHVRPELQSDAILTALERFPLRDAPLGLELALIVLSAALVGAMTAWRSAGGRRGSPGLAWCGVGAVGAQLAFDGGHRDRRARRRCARSRFAIVGAGRRRPRAPCGASARSCRRRSPGTSRPITSSGWRRSSSRAAAWPSSWRRRSCSATCAAGPRSPRAPSPTELIASLNRYLGQVSEAVMDHGGSVVTFLGDGVMSVFGAPLPSDGPRRPGARRRPADPRRGRRRARRRRPGERPRRVRHGRQRPAAGVRGDRRHDERRRARAVAHPRARPSAAAHRRHPRAARRRGAGRRSSASASTRSAAASSPSSSGLCRELDTTGVAAVHDTAGAAAHTRASHRSPDQEERGDATRVFSTPSMPTGDRVAAPARHEPPPAPRHARRRGGTRHRRVVCGARARRAGAAPRTDRDRQRA